MRLDLRGWCARQLEELGRLSSRQLAARIVVLPSEAVPRAGTATVSYQSIAGQFEVDGNCVCFTPRFPFVDGASYTVSMDGASWTIGRPHRELGRGAEVVSIFPSARDLALNQLKLYIQFSDAMSEGWASRAVHVLRADDRTTLEGVLLPMEPELWDHARTRLTLLLDPGRIKRGLEPHQQVGYPLRPDVDVIVRVDESFRDALGRPLRAAAERHYGVGPAVRSKVDPRSWRLAAPASGSREPVVLSFERPLDRALLEHALSIVDGDGSEIVGAVTIGAGEESWRLVPRTPWQTGSYSVVVAARLEDLAGNSLARVFDRDLSRSQDDPLALTHALIAFQCAAAGE